MHPLAANGLRSSPALCVRVGQGGQKCGQRLADIDDGLLCITPRFLTKHRTVAGGQHRRIARQVRQAMGSGALVGEGAIGLVAGGTGQGPSAAMRCVCTAVKPGAVASSASAGVPRSSKAQSSQRDNFVAGIVQSQSDQSKVLSSRATPTSGPRPLYARGPGLSSRGLVQRGMSRKEARSLRCSRPTAARCRRAD